MKYHEILKALIGIPSLSARLDNPFPLVGDKVTISSTSEWVRQHEYLLDGGAGPERSVLDCVLGKSSETVDMSAAGEFIQSVSVSNDSGNASVRKIAYPMLPATEPYFMVTATEIVRVGERGYLSIYAENGYATSRNNTIVARIYKENEPEPVKTVGFDTSRPGPTVWAASPYTFDAVSDRGIYDVEVDVTDVLTGVTFTKRINKLITVTPALAPRDEAVEYLVPDAKIVGGAESWIIDGKDYPAGCTVILKYDPQFGERYPMRLRLDNFKGTRENPIIFTIDTEEPFEFNWFYWFGILFNDCAHIVFDGRGYHNLDKGFRMIAMPEFANIAIPVTNYSNELEFLGLEIWDTTVLIIIPVPTATGRRSDTVRTTCTTPAYTVISMRIRVMTTSSSIMPKMPRYAIMNSSMAVTVWRRTRHRLLPSVSVAKYTTMSYAGISALPSSACAWVMWRFSTISSLPARKSQALSIWGASRNPRSPIMIPG